MARLAGLIGRGRAIEVVLGADDFPGALAEGYGYVNRAIPDSDLDAFVDRFARRIAGFDKEALTDAKRFIDEASLPGDDLFPPALDQFFISTRRPTTRARMAKLLEAGLQKRTDIELNLAQHVASTGVGDLPSEAAARER